MNAGETRTHREEADRKLVDLTTRLLESAGRGLERSLFLREALTVLGDHAHCNTALVHMDSGTIITVRRKLDLDVPASTCNREGPGAEEEPAPTAAEEDYSLPQTLRAIPNQFVPVLTGRFSDCGSFWTGHARRARSRLDDPLLKQLLERGGWNEEIESVAMVPFQEDGESRGYLQFSRTGPPRFSAREVRFLEALSRVFSLSLKHWRLTWSSQERVKELTCLYRIANVLDTPEKSTGDILQEIVKIIPAAWLYNEDAVSRIQFDDRSYITQGYKEGSQEQSADIVIAGRTRGRVQVAYLRHKPELSEGPFLAEERKLLDMIARVLSLRIERRLYEEERAKIKEQLKHSNRLAVIGQLAAAVAHELNDPLTNILGFAQLAAKDLNFAGQSGNDLEKIIANSLHAREIVRKLLLYGRKMPQRKTLVDVNKVAKEALSLFEHRLNKEHITLELRLSPDVRNVTADPAHLRQVVANLVINSIQAMPDGGVLTVSTLWKEPNIEILIQDTGCGIGEAIRDKIFIPFFTTKDPDRGTGLGLPVVQEIVTALCGSINIDSAPGLGTTVSVSLPAQEDENTRPNGE